MCMYSINTPICAIMNVVCGGIKSPVLQRETTAVWTLSGVGSVICVTQDIVSLQPGVVCTTATYSV